MLVELMLVLQVKAAQPAPVYDNLGAHHRTINTADKRAQLYFDQGLRLAYAFNQAESIRSFRAAAEMDPQCAICWWGVAYGYGPNVNLPMDSAANAAATAAVAQAKRRTAHASGAERDLILALEKRHGAAAGPQGDSAYANAMMALAKKYPADLDIATLAAEAQMLLRPWNYWKPDGTPYPGTAEVVALLEKAIAVNPNHPGACHFYIHAVEAVEPQKAVGCAERLGELMPGAGHLVHMPAHIYIRVGRWNDAIRVNQHAVHADEQYIADQNPTGVYPVAYYPHNHHFLAFAATMAGRSQLALEHAKAVRANIPVEAAAAFAVLQPLSAYPYVAMVTFGKWDELLAEPDPPAELRIATALALYAKGVANAVKGHGDVARQHLERLSAIATETTEAAGTLDKTLDIAQHALMGEIALRAGDLKSAEQHFRVALQIENELLYTEPPDWYYPMEHSLGAVLLAQGRAAEAEELYREDLRVYAGNVWSLTGLAAALKAQGKNTSEVTAQLAAAMKEADVTPAASRF